MKQWVRPLWDFIDQFEDEVVWLTGEDLQQVSGKTIKVEKQYFSVAEW